MGPGVQSSWGVWKTDVLARLSDDVLPYKKDTNVTQPTLVRLRHLAHKPVSTSTLLPKAAPPMHRLKLHLHQPGRCLDPLLACPTSHDMKSVSEPSCAFGISSLDAPLSPCIPWASKTLKAQNDHPQPLSHLITNRPSQIYRKFSSDVFPDAPRPCSNARDISP
ncbi:uncharacterized protein K460DRAFT_26423 [Cucurbitaria berberidis CBS 394.84]|uniref:Uncharacterized protein n=1 Tax=Cucurbitaria berberidis CBS 394.84 TaxID=1168544 RepID=A0A9P4GSP1_9PLEO|nr:uncharacterized protein K460DRAFT_26423 [Cucurbitaria berberidis CBS 394.84]KAF1851025.1 hypothetical protein K460DRAFT_26423 [Cucurbitaria berberidis CBS 394.84]